MKALEREHKARLSLAWHTVALDRTAKLPPLADLFGGQDRLGPKASQTPDEMMLSLRKWQFAMVEVQRQASPQKPPR